MLSGGLDSSLIAALARKHIRDLHTFTLVFDHQNSEGEYAKLVSEHIGSKHHELFIDTQKILEKLREIILYFDDLSSVDGGLLTTYLMGSILKDQGIKVILLGEGSDEVNAGYGKFQSLENFSVKQIKEFLDLNLLSHILVCQAVIRHLKNKTGGDIIIMGSEAGVVGKKKSTLYSAAKFGLRGPSRLGDKFCYILYSRGAAP